MILRVLGVFAGIVPPIHVWNSKFRKQVQPPGNLISMCEDHIGIPAIPGKPARLRDCGLLGLDGHYRAGRRAAHHLTHSPSRSHSEWQDRSQVAAQANAAICEARAYGRLIAGDVIGEAGLGTQQIGETAAKMIRPKSIMGRRRSVWRRKAPPHTSRGPMIASSEIYMTKTPFERPNHPQRLPEAPSPSSTSASEGMERARALARRYLPDAARLLAGIALRAGQ
jgi:hypothetical protein